MIGTLRRVLSSALGVGRGGEAALPAPAPGRSRTRHADTARRIDDARRRLKATIPPPED